jgi:hypothetical protein
MQKAEEQDSEQQRLDGEQQRLERPSTLSRRGRKVSR